MGRLKGLRASLAKHTLQTGKASSGDKVAKHQDWKQKRRQVPKQPTRAPWIPFTPDNLVVLIGEGDFSFAASIVDHYPNLIATSLDSAEEVRSKYTSASENIERLTDSEALVLHKVDATHLRKYNALRKATNDHGNIVFVFNFPHLGNSVADVDRNIRQHQELVLNFFREVHSGWPNAKVVLSLFDGEPYASWECRRLGRLSGFSLERSGRFDWNAYSGYSHQLTAHDGRTTSKPQRQRPARSYVFTSAAAATEIAASATKGISTKRDDSSESD